MEKTYRPKQTVIIFVICAVLVGGTALYVYGMPSTKSSIEYKNVSVKTPIKDVVATSSDTEWQKLFFENNKTEILSKTGSSTKKASTTNVPLNATELLGRNFFEKYAELHKAGLTSDDTKSVETLTNQIISESVASVNTPKVYSAKDIKVIPVGNNIDPTKKYAENLVSILKPSMSFKNELEITMNALEKDDMTILKEIDPIIVGYKTILNKLLAEPVIQPLAQYHLNLINGVSMRIFNTESLRKVDSDPLTGLAAISLEIKSLETISDALSNIQSYFTKVGIVFILPASNQTSSPK